MTLDRETGGNDAVEPFVIDVPGDVLVDLRRRLLATRWPDPEPVDDWSQGVPLAYLRDICQTWAQDYDWRAREARMNQVPQFRTEIDNLDIHFLHVRSPEPDAMPLLLTHGWPGSFVEFLDVVGPLSDPVAHGGDRRDAFHVVCPSLPGYGFSAKPTEPGWGIGRIAQAWTELMRRLGYSRYGAQGGDWGSAVTASIANVDPDHCLGIHLNMVPHAIVGREASTPDEQAALADIKRYQRWDAGYSTQQSSRPQTLGYGLTDSPSAQAAWIVEKFWAWSDCDGHPEHAFSREQMLDNVMIYWVTGTATSSARLYWESFHGMRLQPVTIPTGIAVFPKEIIKPIRRWAESTFPNIVHWTEQPRGGHFAAFEQPQLFVDDVRTFFRNVR